MYSGVVVPPLKLQKSAGPGLPREFSSSRVVPLSERRDIFRGILTRLLPAAPRASGNLWDGAKFESSGVTRRRTRDEGGKSRRRSRARDIQIIPSCRAEGAQPECFILLTKTWRSSGGRKVFPPGRICFVSSGAPRERLAGRPAERYGGG